MIRIGKSWMISHDSLKLLLVLLQLPKLLNIPHFKKPSPIISLSYKNSNRSFSHHYASKFRSAAKAAYKVIHKYYLKTLTTRATYVATIIDP